MLDIAPMFEALDLRTFCESYAEVSVAKVLEFYSNLNFYRDGRSIKFIRTSVNGVTLVYSALDVCNLYGCVSTAEMQDFGKNDAFSIIVGQKVTLKNYLESTRLDLRLRVLHRAVLFSLLPRAGSVDTIMPADAKVMVHLLEGIPFSLGALIFEHMEWSLSRKEKSLPYGQVIAGLLQMHGIDATPTSEQDKWKVGNFGANIISSMQYVKTAEGWLTKAQHYELLNKAPSAAAKGKKPVRAPPAHQKGSAPSAEEVSASSSLPSVLKELQLQVVAQGEDIRVLQRLVMDAIRQLEGLNKFLHDNLEAPADA